jgi:hypothetical protein
MGNARCYMHRVAEDNSFVDAAAEDQFFNCAGDVDEPAAAFYFEPEVLGQGFHFLGVSTRERLAQGRAHWLGLLWK